MIFARRSQAHAVGAAEECNFRVYDAAFTLREDPSALAHDQLKRALTYLVNQRHPLLAHLDNGRIPIHNNDTERDIRHVVIGRKNWMTFASERGGLVAGRLYSLAMSCKFADINIESYLEDVLNRVATTPSSRIAELTPWGWAAVRSAELAGSDTSGD